LGWLQREAGKAIGVNAFTFLTWEKGRAEPEVRYWPTIISFLGYDPSPEPATIGQWIVAELRRAGLPRNKLAKLMNWDEGSLHRYETDQWQLPRDRMRALERLIGNSGVEAASLHSSHLTG